MIFIFIYEILLKKYNYDLIKKLTGHTTFLQYSNNYVNDELNDIYIDNNTNDNNTNTKRYYIYNEIDRIV